MASWLREEQPEQAVEKILDAAEKAFVELGVPAASMARIADFAGCSRGTLYRYFPNRHELHRAYVSRRALQIVERVGASLAGIEDPRQRLIECILGSVREVRQSPDTAAWFEPGVAGLAVRMSRSSEVVQSLAAAFVAKLLGPRGDDSESRFRARWFVRVIVSLLVMPAESEAEERALVERFVAPTLSFAAEQS